MITLGSGVGVPKHVLLEEVDGKAFIGIYAAGAMSGVCGIVKNPQSPPSAMPGRAKACRVIGVL